MDVKLIYLITSVASFLFNVALSGFVLYKNPKEQINRVFSIWALSVGIICLGDFMRKTSEVDSSAMLWSRFMLLGVAMLMPTLLNFALLLKPQTRINIKYFSVIYNVPSILTIALLPTSLLVYGVELVNWRYSIVWGPLMDVFGAIFGVYLLAGVYVLLKKTWFKKPEKYLFLSFGATVILGLALNFVPSLNVEIPTISPLAMFASALFAYLVFKNRYVIISYPESNLESELKYEMASAQTHLVMESRVDLSYSMFVDQVTHGKAGLIVTRKSPAKVKERHELTHTPILWLSNIEQEGSITNLQGLTFTILSFLGTEERNRVVLLDGIEYLITQNGFLNTLKALHFINDYVIKNEAIMIVPLSPNVLEDHELQLLQTEMKMYAGAEEPVIYEEGQRSEVPA
jgi:uncharacterized membrane protein YoaK (UPF0700 family)